MRISLHVLLILLFASFTGCSKSSPVEPLNYKDLPGANEAKSLLVLESGLISLDTDIDVPLKPELRSPAFNIDVTGFLSSSCPGGCLTYEITGISGTELTIKLTLENPTSLDVYDVRIIYENLYGKEILDPDSYTDIFDPFNPRPFNAFSKWFTQRKFPTGPGATDYITIHMNYPPLAQPYVDYTIIASYPENTGEPYEISQLTQSGFLTQAGDVAEIWCRVKDHQDDISLVAADTAPLTGGITVFERVTSTDNRYATEIVNTELAPPGEYVCPVAAMSPNPQNAHTFGYITLTVTEFPGWGEIQEIYGFQEGHEYLNPDIAFDSAGNVHAIWTDLENTGPGLIDYNILYSNNVNETWSAPIVLSDLPVTINHEILPAPKIAINDNDFICVVWSQYYSVHNARNRLYWNYNDGSGWSGHDLLFDMNYLDEVDPQLTSDDSFFYLAFRTGLEMGLIWASRYNTIDSWLEPVNVNDPIDMEYYIRMEGDNGITAASRGGTFVTFTLRGTGPDDNWQLFYDESWDGCVTWGMDTAVISDYDPVNEYDDIFPSIQLDNGGDLHALWRSERLFDEKVFYDTNESGSWGTDIAVSRVVNLFDPPVLEITPPSTRHICHISRYSIGAGLSYSSTTDGAHWEPVISLAPYRGYCYDPSGSTDKFETIGYTWVQYTDQDQYSIVYRERDLSN